jgi:hypothetical protein
MIGSTVVNYQSDEDSEYDEDTENVSRKMPIVTQSVLHQPNDQLPFSGRNLKEGGQSFQARLYGQLPDIRSMITAEVTLINPISNSSPFTISYPYPYPYPYPYLPLPLSPNPNRNRNPDRILNRPNRNHKPPLRKSCSRANNIQLSAR